jgi:hypothetical protein
LDADECLESFYDELKENKLIKSLHLDTIEQTISMFNLGYFLQNNTNMKDLELLSDDDRLVTMEQGHMIGAALRGAQLRRLDICCAFENNAAFGLIVSACLGVEDLSVICETNSHYTALAALIQNPMSMLKILSVDQNIGEESDEEAFDGRLVLRELAASLVGNTAMKELYLPLFTEEEVDEFEALLCNSSSLGNIYNSNHTLEKIRQNIQWPYYLSAFISECLQLNENENKNKVIQNKIMQFYFAQGFDISPFANMPTSVLAQVISAGEGMCNKQTSIFELLRCIPDLCNVSSRSAELGQNYNLMECSLDFKRQRVHN